jgi:molecular chaperone HscB
MYKCWNCQNDTEAKIMCVICNVIQPLNPTNPFEYLGLSPTFDISVAQLSDNYLNRQHTLHPDKFVTKSAEEKLYAQQHSSYINQCYQILNNNITRAEALLAYHGHSINKEEKTIQNPVLLHESMENHEKLMIIESKDQILKFKEEIEEKIFATEKELKETLDQIKDFEQAKLSVLRLKYLHKILTEINQKEASYS